MFIFHLSKHFTPFMGVVFNSEPFPSRVEEKFQLNLTEAYSSVVHKHKVDDILLTFSPHPGYNPLSLAFAVETLRKHLPGSISLFMPYLPYARQDRIMDSGESFTLKVFCNFINSLNFNKVYVFDAHSDVGPALLNNCVNIPNYDFVKKVIDDTSQGVTPNYRIVSPDAGSLKKVYKLSEALGSKEDIVKADKNRNVVTGKIKSIDITSDFIRDPEVNLYVVDDICSYGGTFIGLGEKIQDNFRYKNLYLIVSHLENCARLNELSEYYTNIYCTESLPRDVMGGDFVRTISFKLEWIKS